MWKNYLIIAFRTLINKKIYSGINLLGLTVGVAATVLLFFYIQHQLSFDSFHESKDSVFRVLRTQKNGNEISKGPSMPLALRPIIEQNFGEEMIFTNIVNNNFLTKEEGGEGFNQPVTFVSPGFFEIFSFKMLKGTFPTSSEMRYGLVVSENTAQKLFGDRDPVGKTLLIRLADEFIDFNVLGVIENTPSNSSLTYELLMLDDNLDVLYTPEQRDHWYMAFGDAYLMVKSGRDPRQFEESLQAHIHRIFNDREKPINYNFSLQPLLDVYMNTAVGEGSAASMNPRILWILAGIGFLIILIACINFTTMAIGSSSGRAREVGVRKTMGAGSSQLFGQFMAESLILTLSSLGLGLILAKLLLPTFNKLMETGLEISYSINQILIILGMGIFIALLAGSYPAIFLASFKPVQVLKSNINLKFGKQNLRLSLLGFQSFISIFLITCTLVMYRQMKTIEEHDLGINHSTVLQINVPPPASHGLLDFIENGFAYGQVFKNEIRRFSEVENVSMACAVYGDNTWFQASFDDLDGKRIDLSINVVDEDYVELFGLQVLEGRNFSANIPSDRSGGFLLNESMKYALAWDEVIGNSLESKKGFPENRAVGLVKNFHFESLYHDIEPAILVTDPKPIFEGMHSLFMVEDVSPKIFVRLNSRDLQASIKQLNGAWKALYGSDPFDYKFVDDTIAYQYAQDASLQALVSIASVLAIIIAGMGLFAMASLTISSRIKEIGIRKVLGASILEISFLFNKQFLKITLIGTLFAIPFSYYMMQLWLNDFAVKTTMGVGVFLISLVVGIGFSVFIVSVQTIKAAKSNPVHSLKSE